MGSDKGSGNTDALIVPAQWKELFFFPSPSPPPHRHPPPPPPPDASVCCGVRLLCAHRHIRIMVSEKCIHSADYLDPAMPLTIVSHRCVQSSHLEEAHNREWSHLSHVLFPGRVIFKGWKCSCSTHTGECGAGRELRRCGPAAGHADLSVLLLTWDELFDPSICKNFFATAITINFYFSNKYKKHQRQWEKNDWIPLLLL